MTKKIRFLDLFAGAGGLSEGFIQAGYIPIAHVESDRAACFTLKTRMAYHWLNDNSKEEVYRDYLTGRITRDELYKTIPKNIINSVINSKISRESLHDTFKKIDVMLNGGKLDLIIGGPPCQAYSLVGRSRDSKRMVGDERNYLYKLYAEFLKKYQPKFFVFENVTGLLSAKDGSGNSYFKAMLNLFKEYGYSTEYEILSADDYGVLQTRKRIILIGKKGNQTGFYPQLSKWDFKTTVSAVFESLPAIKAGEGQAVYSTKRKQTGEWLQKAGIVGNDVPITLHQARPNNEQDLEIYRIVVNAWNKEKRRLEYNELPEHLKSHNNRTAFVDRFKVVAADLEASHTVVAHLSKDGHYYIHPDVKQNRSITPREAARLQSFPDDYYFESITPVAGRTAAFRQIGNAVPVLLAKQIAEKLRGEWYE